jgi:hypothetical protein
MPKFAIADERGDRMAADLLSMHPSTRGFRGAWKEAPGYCVFFNNLSDAQQYCDALASEGFRDIAVIPIDAR